MVCFPGDLNCFLNDFIQGWIIPFIFILVLLLVAIFVLPKAGWKGVVLSIVIIFGIMWWFGLIPGLPALRQYFGMSLGPVV
jgi:hypothetical protein